MDYRFTDLVDAEGLHNMLQSLYEATGIMHGLTDADNHIISAVGWEEACTNFHRAHPCTNARCLESNCYLAEHLGEGAFVGSACTNGLMDYATPIVIEGRHLATLYFGQVLHEPPDLEFFRRQAEQFGFDEEAYLAAIRKVPVIPKERVEPIMAFYVQLAQMLARSGLDRLRQREAERGLEDLNRNLAQRIEERTAELAAKNDLLWLEIAERRRAEEALYASQQQIKAILDSSPVGIGWAGDGRIEYLNHKFTELFGYRLEDIPTLEAWYQRAYPDEKFRNEIVGKWTRATIAAKETGTEVPPLEVPVTCKNGAVRHVVIAATWIGDYLLANFSDISDRWRAEQRYRSHNATLELIAKGASLQQILSAIVRNAEAQDPRLICSILLVDADGRHLRTGAAPGLPEFYNQAVDGIEIGKGIGSCGTAAATLQRVIVADVQTHPYWEKFKEIAARAGLASCWSEPILSSKGRLLGTFAIYHGQPCTPDDEALQLIGYAANLASIAIEHHQTQDELERQAHTDFLTGLANRRHFIKLAEVELARARRYGKPLSLFMIDVDHFKAVNDSLGHDTGDRVLQDIAAALVQTLRTTDVIGRFGGEEFAVVLPDTPATQAGEAAERLRRTIAATDMQGDSGPSLHTTVSVGVSTLTDAPADLNTLLKHADDALYIAKNGGRNQVRMIFDVQQRIGADAVANFIKLTWHGGYACGHPKIDEQHQALFRRINDLLASTVADCPPDRVIAVLDSLIAEVVRHFRDEEAVLQEIGFPGLTRHAAIHRQLADRATELTLRFRKDKLAIGDLLRYLTYELVAGHMLKEDREYYPYLLQARQNSADLSRSESIE
ncbi:MAG: diguanylate cyclase [Methylococcus sp.]|nr:diguanylate cyclase [Methylococcus sp.]